MVKYLCIFFGIIFLTYNAMAKGVGQSLAPHPIDKKLMTVEFTSIFNDGGSMGVQGRYSQKLARAILLDMGIGAAGGERPTNAFIGADFEIYPDYVNQPRVSIRTGYEHTKEFGERKNKLFATPTISKGFSFWGHPAYPFVSFPMALRLEQKGRKYTGEFSASLGIAGPVPVQGYQQLSFNIEGFIKLSESTSGVFAGLTFPMN